MPRSELAGARGEICCRALESYLAGRFDFFSRSGSTADFTPISMYAAGKIKDAADLLANAPARLPDEREFLRILRVSLYDMALTACPGGASDHPIGSEIYETMQYLKSEESAETQPEYLMDCNADGMAAGIEQSAGIISAMPLKN